MLKLEFQNAVAEDHGYGLEVMVNRWRRLSLQLLVQEQGVRAAIPLDFPALKVIAVILLLLSILSLLQ